MITDDDLRNDPNLAHYYALRRGQKFHHVERLELRQTDGFGWRGDIASLEVVLSSAEPNDGRILKLTFNGVLNLRLTPPPRMVISLTTLEVSPVRDLQWEGVSYSVKETDEDTLAFLCRDFTADIR